MLVVMLNYESLSVLFGYRPKRIIVRLGLFSVLHCLFGFRNMERRGQNRTAACCWTQLFFHLNYLRLVTFRRCLFVLHCDLCCDLDFVSTILPTLFSSLDSTR